MAQAQANVEAAAVAGNRQAQAREVRLTEFSKLAPRFNGRLNDPVDAENWIMGVEKSFVAFDVVERMKMPYAEFQLEEFADD